MVSKINTYRFNDKSIRSYLKDKERFYALVDVDRATNINRSLIQPIINNLEIGHEIVYSNILRGGNGNSIIAVNLVGIKRIRDYLKRKHPNKVDKLCELYDLIRGDSLDANQKGDKEKEREYMVKQLNEAFEEEIKKVEEIELKEYQGQRVVTLKDVDEVHGRIEGTAKRNFSQNKKHLIEDTDFFVVSPSQKNEFRTLEIPNRGLILLTESGYLMLVKSFTDNLSWEVQRELVHGYFKPNAKKQSGNFQLPTTFAEALRLAADLEEEKQELETQNLMLEQQVSEYQPKATYVDKILESKDSLLVSQIAEDYGLTAQKLNNILKQEGVQYKRGGQWLLYGDHKGNGYTESQTHTFSKPNGETGTNLLTKWTQKGRLFIHNILESKGIYAIMDKENE